MFRKILIANRGEIAVRVARTARAMGIRTVAVFSDADARALHVAACDEAVGLGGTTPAESYLRIDAVVAAARATGAQAIHPGYGFLSENPDFVDAVAAAGLVFVGPSADAIRAMGLKDAAKARVAAAGVPVVPGYHGTDQDDARLAEEAAAVGYPVLIKAVAGGGGKGMRVVESAGDFADALAGARAEARAAFGNDRVLIEKFLTTPRHIEVQVFGDGTRARALFERDCSLQRRHQKVIEEAPAPGMTAEMRGAMEAAAVRAAEAIGYAGAGTVEFIAEASGGLDPDQFYFMEMNTRLQVEHPVTEAITGVDLVEWQLRVAAGEPLPDTPLAIRGHAIEARLYAEDPAAGFLPATGRLAHLAFPRGVRVDTGVRAGDAVTPHYDPMIAKLIAWAPDRGAAIAALHQALGETDVAGLTTNLAFLRALLAHEDVAAGRVDTGLIARAGSALTAPPVPCARTRAIAAVAAGMATPQDTAPDAMVRPATMGAGDIGGPASHRHGVSAAAEGHGAAWAHPVAASASPAVPRGGAERPVADTLGPSPYAGFTLWAPLRRRTRLAWDGTSFDAVVEATGPGQAVVEIDGARLTVARADGAWWVDGAKVAARAVAWPGGAAVYWGNAYHFDVPDPLAVESGAGAGEGRVAAPMPGLVRAVFVRPGDTVAAGDRLAILEAMKMEHTLRAGAAATVADVCVAEGDQVEAGAALVLFEPPS